MIAFDANDNLWIDNKYVSDISILASTKRFLEKLESALNRNDPFKLIAARQELFLTLNDNKEKNRLTAARLALCCEDLLNEAKPEWATPKTIDMLFEVLLNYAEKGEHECIPNNLPLVLDQLSYSLPQSKDEKAFQKKLKSLLKSVIDFSKDVKLNAHLSLEVVAKK